MFDFQINGQSVIYRLHSFQRTKNDKNVATYRLSGIGDDLISSASYLITSKQYFSCEIRQSNKVVLKGEDCFFNDLNPFQKIIDLVINWVEIDVV